MTAALTHTTTADPPPSRGCAARRRSPRKLPPTGGGDSQALCGRLERLPGLVQERRSRRAARRAGDGGGVSAWDGTATASAGTLARRAAAIAAQHRQAGRAPMPKAVTSHAA